MLRKSLLSLCLLAVGFQGAGAAPETPLVDRAAATGFIQIEAPSFAALPLREKTVAYWLYQAAIAIDPIIYDQLSAYGLREKRLFEELLSRAPAIPAADRRAIETYAKLFWANRGNHNESTAQKFVPEFTAATLRRAAFAVQDAGGFTRPYADLPALSSRAALAAELAALEVPLFDRQFEPMATAKSALPGKDIIQSSSNTFYGPGVTLADVEAFKAEHPLNSRLIKSADGTLHEEVYRAGTADGSVPPGLYAVFLRRAVGYLRNAAAAADPAQANVIRQLIRFYETGDFSAWLAFGRSWVHENSPVDFVSGFIEIYRDAAGAKGSSQSFVAVTDLALTRATMKLGANAGYFEERAPWLPQYQKHAFRPPVIKSVEPLVETGDFHAGTIGDNLPNENEIRETDGSKNFLFSPNSRAITRAIGDKLNREFYPSEETIARRIKYGAESDDLLTALHEVIGHGSGKLSDRLKGGSESYLKEYYSTLEEARADLMALWNCWDPKIDELGLVSNRVEVAKAMYDRYAEQVVMQLRTVPHGTTIEEDHQRDRALIGNYIISHTHAARIYRRGGKTYGEVLDYEKMRAGIGELLAEIMRIKAEGDYPAIKALIERYGVHFDPAVRDEVVARYRKLDLPTYWAGIYPQLGARTDGYGNITRVTIDYPRDAIHQYLLFGAMYCAPAN